MPYNATLRSRLEKRIYILDGAMGTMIMRASPTEADFRGERFVKHPVALKGCNDILSLTAPEIISSIHHRYLQSGADIISTNTFNSNSLSLSEYHLSDIAPEIARAGALVARSAADGFAAAQGLEGEKKPLVAGSMGPTNISLSMQDSMNPEADFYTMAEAYRLQTLALMEGGVDLLLLETIFDTLNAKAAASGMLQGFTEAGRRIPVMVSATLGENGRLFSGETLEQFVGAIEHLDPISIGLNCGFGLKALMPYIRQLSGITERLISIHPNAGLPDALGCYRDTPSRMVSELTPLMSEGGINIVGGCCGTTPDHISMIATEARNHTPRPLHPRKDA